MTATEWRRPAGLAVVVAPLHAIGFFLLFAVIVPQHFSLGGGGLFGVRVGITAYTLGMRHAFDADHIAAIDNTTRKLMTDGQRPLSVGLFFSLGHSTVVFVLAVLFRPGHQGAQRGGVRQLGAAHDHQPDRASVSGVFLMVIGILNLVVLWGIVKVFRLMRGGSFSEAELEEQLNNRELLNRFYKWATNAVKKPWQMYPLGVLFGLGFDTATEIALLATAGAAATSGLGAPLRS